MTGICEFLHPDHGIRFARCLDGGSYSLTIGLALAAGLVILWRKL